MPHITHTFAAAENAFLVNSFILEGEHSVVVIDSQFLISSANALSGMIDEIGKPLAGLILTHPHPDHYNGTATLLDSRAGVPIIATAKAASGIRSTAEAKRDFWTPTYGDDYPQHFLFPDRIVAPDETLTIDDVVLRFEELGPGESQDMVVIYAPETQELFASDLIYSSCHPWLAEDRSDQWLAQLDYLEKQYSAARIVHAGHGRTRDFRVINEQRSYILEFRDRVTRLASHQLTDESKAAIKAETEQAHPDFPLGWLIDYNSESIIRERS